MTQHQQTLKESKKMDYNLNGIRIQKQASISDGYDGGIVVLRDATNVEGGTPGNVICANYTMTITGKNEKSFEWNALQIMNNYSDFGENVANYSQSNKYGLGSTWAFVAEVCTLDPEDKSGQVGAEVDVWCSGKDSGNRVGVDVVVGDSRIFRGKSKSDFSEASYGVRIGASTGTPYSIWSTGLKITNSKVGIDLSENASDIAIRLRPGQVIEGLTLPTQTVNTVTIQTIDKKSVIIASAALVLSVISILSSFKVF